MSVKKLMSQSLWNEATQQWEDYYPKSLAGAIETEDGGNVQAKLDEIPGQITAAKESAISEIRADVAENGNTLAKLYGLITALQELVNSDDVDLDTVQEIADYIKANRSDLTLMGTNKVNYTDIVNELTTISSVEGKVLDARQGKIIKDFIDNLTTDVTNLQAQAQNFITEEQLTTGLASAKIIMTETAPSNPADGQIWFKPAGTITVAD